MLHNPMTGGTTWFHGTPHDFERFRAEAPDSLYDPDDLSSRAWNTLLGHHFTAHHETAEDFASGVYKGRQEPDLNGRVVHAALHIKNPKVYGSESEMTRHVLTVPHRPGEQSHHAYLRWLHENGHDGVVYGNEVEGPHLHPCAIALHPDDIEITQHHPVTKRCRANPDSLYAEGRRSQLPPAPGTAPIPEGHLRLFHYTHPDNIDSIREHGLLESKSRGDGNLGAGNEPSAGVWASTKTPDRDFLSRAAHVEFHAHPDEISDRAESPWRVRDGLDSLEDFQKGWHHVIMNGDVKPHQIVAIHEPWHAHARYMLDNDMADEVKAGQHDHLLDDPEYGPALRYVKQAGVLDKWTPTERLFAPTKTTLDPTLFDADHQMRANVRTVLMDKMVAFLRHNGWSKDWSSWLRMYLSGSQASYWWGNHDFDILVGIEYDRFRATFDTDQSDDEITQAFNVAFNHQWNDEHWHPPFDPDEEWHLTGYVNHDSWDIRRIKPYAAYEVVSQQWFVQPISEPEGHRFDETFFYLAEGYAEQIRSALRMPEPVRTKRLTRLWHFLHSDRSRAFGPHGSGAFDRGNAVEKYLDQAPSGDGDKSLWQAMVDARFHVAKKARYVTVDEARAAARACPACSGSGEQGTGHECYKCDGTGLADEYDPSIDNANPENGLPVGRDDSIGQKPVTAVSRRYYHASWEQFQPGDRILPRHQLASDALKEQTLPPYPKGEEWRGDRVWLNHDPGRAGAWYGHDEPLTKVYEVSPHDVRTHTNTSMDGEVASDHAEDQYHAAYADVIRELPLSEWNDFHRQGRKSAVVRTLTKPIGVDDELPQGVMVHLVPPGEHIEPLLSDEGEHADVMHMTLAYLGKVGDHSEEQIRNLPEVVQAWAEGQQPIDAKIQGVGTFVNTDNPNEDERHVLWATADIPGGPAMHVSLVDYLRQHGYKPYDNHGWMPHITLGYSRHHYRFLPKLDEKKPWPIREVWLAIGPRWESFPLGTA